MKPSRQKTPAGTRDRLYEECAKDSLVSASLKELYESAGYRRVVTPMLEFFDVFTGAEQTLPAERMFTLTDAQGRLMVLRPDCTVPIARITAGRLSGQPLPLRLYYSQNICRRYPEGKGRRTETHQAGIELIGSGDLAGDCEAMELAAESLARLSDGFRLELCHIGYFKALVEALDTDEETAEQIRLAVETKNYGRLNDLLRAFPDTGAVRALRRLPALFGGPEVLEAAAALFDGGTAGEALARCREVYAFLQDLGLGDAVMLDLGLVGQVEYYTGLVIRGYFDGIGEPVLSGGRYDQLCGTFGEPHPAVGFAVDMELAARAVDAPADERQTVYVRAEGPAAYAAAAACRRDLRAKGIRAVCADGLTEEEWEALPEGGVLITADEKEVRP